MSHRRVRTVSAKTNAARRRRNEHLAIATAALASQGSLRVSNTTNAETGTVHHGTAMTLVREGKATWGTLSNGFQDDIIDRSIIHAH